MPMRALGARALLVVPLAATLSCGAADGSGVPGAGAAAKPLPDLRPGTPSFSLEGTTGIRVSFELRNRGRTRARRSLAAVYLSRARTRGGGDTRLARLPVRALAGGGSASVRRTSRLPRALRSGRYWVIACADVQRQVREASERNNCRLSRGRVLVSPRSGDVTAPRFGGVDSVTTCIPGPSGGPAVSSRFQLFWKAATDDSAPPAAIVYDVYQANTPGSLDLGSPAYTTRPGAVSFTTPELSSKQSWHFLVRARDQAGNRDRNRVVRDGQNQCR